MRHSFPEGRDFDLNPQAMFRMNIFDLDKIATLLVSSQSLYKIYILSHNKFIVIPRLNNWSYSDYFRIIN